MNWQTAQKGQWFHRIFIYAEMPLVTCVITVGINNDKMNVYLEIFFILGYL